MLLGLETRSGAAAGVSQPGALLRRALDLGPRLGRSGTGRGLGSWGSPSSDGYHVDVCKVLARASRSHKPMAVASRAHVSPGVGRVDADLGVDRCFSVMTAISRPGAPAGDRTGQAKPLTRSWLVANSLGRRPTQQAGLPRRRSDWERVGRRSLPVRFS